MKDVLDRISAHYSGSLEAYGQEARGVGWGDSDKHRLRFDQLLHLLDGETEPISVNDLGCGYGSLLDVLLERGFRVSAFNGYEISDDMRRAAEERIGSLPGVRLSGLPRMDRVADYGFASGIFNVKFEAREEAWQEFVFETLDNMNEFCRKGFAFNILTAHVDWRESHLYYADPCLYFEHCRSNYARKVALLHDAELFEWTMIVRKHAVA